MALEIANYIGQLDKAWPVTGDQIAQGDDQIRLLKATLQKTFPGMMGEVLRAIWKASGFTASVDESTAIYHCNAAITVSLPALGGVAMGVYWFVYATDGSVVLAPNGAETVNWTTTVTIASGSWALVTRSTPANWTALGIPAMTAAAIVAALGTTPVAKATDANTLDGYDSANFVRSVNSTSPDANGNVAVSSGVTSVGGITGAIALGAGLSMSSNTLSSSSKGVTTQFFTGSGTWTRPTGCKGVRVTLKGGGGGGERYVSGSVSNIYSGGSSLAAVGFIDVSGTGSIAFTVGGGGAAYSGAGQSGQGGTTSFGAISSTGGIGYTYEGAAVGSASVSGGYNYGVDPLAPYGAGGLGTVPAAGTAGCILVEEFY